MFNLISIRFERQTKDALKHHKRITIEVWSWEFEFEFGFLMTHWRRCKLCASLIDTDADNTCTNPHCGNYGRPGK